MLSFGQNPYIELQVEPHTVEVGQQFTIILRTNAEGSLDFEMPDEFTQSGVTHSGMSSSINYINNKAHVEKYSFQKFTGTIDQAGKYKIGPAKLKTNSGELVSKEIIVYVVKPLNMISEDPSRNLNEPVFGIIQQSSKSIFEGEPLILEAKVYAQVDVLQIDRFQNIELQGPHEAHLLHTSKEVEKEMEVIKGKTVLTFKAGKTLVFPERTGTFEVSPFQMTLYCSDAVSLFPTRVTIKSNETKVHVKPLPGAAPTEFIGAVGKFDVISSVNSKKVKYGEVIEYKVSIHGVGNLHNIDIPQLYLPKGVLMYGDPEEKSEVSFTMRGAEGKKEITYYLQVNALSNMDLPALTIAFFDPESEKYVMKSTKSFAIEVTNNESLVMEDPELEGVNENESSLFIDPMMKLNPTVLPQTSIGSLSVAVSIPPLLALVFGLFFRYRAQHKDELIIKSVKKTAGSRAKERIQFIQSTEGIDFSNELAQVFYTYLAEKWNCSSAEITRDTITQRLKKEQHVKELLRLLDELDVARFGGGTILYEKEQMCARVDALIDSFDKDIV